MSESAAPTRPTGQTVTCPACGAATPFSPVAVVREGDDNLKALFAGALNRVLCQGCQRPFLCELPMLYRDDRARYVVYYLPRSLTSSVEAALETMTRLYESIFSELPVPTRPECRLTLHRNQFIEKIALHRQSYDDRLVEYIKYQLFLHSPGLDPVRYQMLYDFAHREEEDDAMQFLVFDRESGKITYTLKFTSEDYADLETYFLDTAESTLQLDGLFRGYFVQVDDLLEGQGAVRAGQAASDVAEGLENADGADATDGI